MQLKKTLPIQNQELWLLKVLVILLFLGRAWQGWFWDLPLRAFFWNQQLLEGWVNYFLNRTWQEYATDVEHVDGFINQLNKAMGWFWAIVALAVFFFNKKTYWLKWLFYVASGTLFLLSLLYWQEKFNALGELLEYSLQVLSPILLVQAVLKEKHGKNFHLAIKILIAISFASHGLYAIGYYPQPGPWLQWCMDMFMMPNDLAASNFLKLMGVLDFIAAGALFVPIFKVQKIALWYCVIWGFMTALARLSSNFYWDFPFQTLSQWGFEVLVRLVHGGIPLLLLIWLNSFEKIKDSQSTGQYETEKQIIE